MRKISRRNFLLASGAVTISAALSACGGSSSSTGAASSAAASSAASAAPAAQGKVLNIWCWNDEFQGRFNNYYPEVASIAEDKSTTTLKDGTVVKWTINANENNNYQNKLDEALLNQDSAADDDKVDIFLIEADYALKYVDSDYALDVKADIGLTDADLAGQYQYTKDIVSVDGSQRGTTWQATPGLFAYRRSIAKEVLGTDDPTEVQSHLSDWDKFNEVAAQAYAKGYKMLSGFDDAYRTFSNNVDAPWVDGTTVKVDPNIMKWVDQTLRIVEYRPGVMPAVTFCESISPFQRVERRLEGAVFILATHQFVFGVIQILIVHCTLGKDFNLFFRFLQGFAELVDTPVIISILQCAGCIFINTYIIRNVSQLVIILMS